MKHTFALIIISLVLGSCTSGEKEASKEVKGEPATPPDFELVTVNHEGFELPIGIPLDYYDENELDVRFNEAVGQLEVRCGEVFHVIVLEEPGNIERHIERVETDLVFKNEMVVREDDALLYRQFLPNNDRSFWHFYVTLEYGDTEYVVKDAPLSELNEYHSRKIFDALVKAAAQNDI
jgi:hypothetical protein